MATVGEGVQVDTVSLRRTLEELRELAPDLRKDLIGELKVIAGEIRDTAAGRVHRVSGDTAKSYKVQLSPRRGLRVVGSTAGAAISEFAAVPHCAQGATLIRTLNAAYGKPGRLLWAAADERKQELDRRVAESVRHTEEALNVRMNRV